VEIKATLKAAYSRGELWGNGLKPVDMARHSQCRLAVGQFSENLRASTRRSSQDNPVAIGIPKMDAQGGDAW